MDELHERALQVFDKLCETMDGHGWKYSPDRDALRIESGAQGEDLPINLIMSVDEKRQLVRLLSGMPFRVKEDKRLDMAVAVSVVNNRLVDGSFDFDVSTGILGFRMTCSYRESILGSDLFSYILFCSCKTIDDFNDKFMMINAGLVSLDQFIETINN